MKRRLAVAVLALVWLVPVGAAAARLTPPPEQPSYRALLWVPSDA